MEQAHIESTRLPDSLTRLSFILITKQYIYMCNRVFNSLADDCDQDVSPACEETPGIPTQWALKKNG